MSRKSSKGRETARTIARHYIDPIHPDLTDRHFDRLVEEGFDPIRYLVVGTENAFGDGVHSYYEVVAPYVRGVWGFHMDYDDALSERYKARPWRIDHVSLGRAMKLHLTYAEARSLVDHLYSIVPYDLDAKSPFGPARQHGRGKAFERMEEAFASWRKPAAARKRPPYGMRPLKKEVPRDRPVHRPIFFASGTNAPGELAGFAEYGDVGTNAKECKPRCVAAYEKLARTGDRRIFVDSGAFAELKGFTKKGPVYYEPPAPEAMTPASWKKVFKLYYRLVKAGGDKIYIVAPDKVADQKVTFKRLAAYLPELRELHQMGANIIVPIQKGRGMSMAQFDAKVGKLLGFPYIRGIPMKKDATSVEDVEEFLMAAAPERVHFLGLSGKGKAVKEEGLLDLIKACCPYMDVSMDTVVIRGITGTAASPGPLAYGKREALAEILDEAASYAGSAILDPETMEEVEIDFWHGVLVDKWVDWLTLPQIRKMGRDIEKGTEEGSFAVPLTSEERKAFRSKEAFERWWRKVDWDRAMDELDMENRLYAFWPAYVATLQKAKEWKSRIVAEKQKRGVERLTPYQRGQIRNRRRR